MNAFKVNLFVLGAAKCGTTTLHDYLSDMPEICMSDPKEPFFFECEYLKGESFYQGKYFSHYNNEPLIGESRHRNLYLPHVPERIHAYNPDAKLIVILRNPVDRAYSHWWHAYSRDYEKLSFELAIHADMQRIGEGKHLDTVNEIEEYCSVEDNVTFYRTYVDTGYYMEQIERYLKLFSREQLCVVLTEDLQNSPLKTINRIREFLELPELSDEEFQPKHSNTYKKPEAGKKTHKLARAFFLHKLLPSSIKSGIYKKYNSLILRRQKMSGKTRRMLIDHFKIHNEHLSEFIKRDLSHWNQ